MTLKGRGGEAQYHTHMHVVYTHTYVSTHLAKGEATQACKAN